MERTKVQPYNSNWALTAGEVHRRIAEQLPTAPSLSSVDWQESRDPVNKHGQSLSALAQSARVRKGSNGKGYFGEGTWKAYLAKHHGQQILFRYLSDEELHLIIGKLLSSGALRNTTFWRGNKTVVDLKQLGIDLPATQEVTYDSLYMRTSRRLNSKGKTFVGTGSWPKYLKQFHNTNFRPRVLLQDEELHDIVEEELARNPEAAKSTFWHKPSEVRPGFSYRGVMGMIQRRNYFNYKTFRQYITKHHGIVKIPPRRYKD